MSDTRDFWHDLRHFRQEEFNEPGKMEETFLRKLDLARIEAGFPFRINSSWRHPDNDLAGNHGRGLAVDVSCRSSTARFQILRGLLAVGFKRIGLYSNHIHVDTNPDKVQSVIWYSDIFGGN